MAYKIEIHKQATPTINVGASEVVHSDAELEALKEQYRQKIALAEQAQAEALLEKNRYHALADELSGVAQDETLQQVFAAVDGIDFSELAKQGEDSSKTNTQLSAEILRLSGEIENIVSVTMSNGNLDDYAKQVHDIVGIGEYGTATQGVVGYMEDYAEQLSQIISVAA